ncbi:MAG: hypothetical protein PHT79_08140 [Syntrophomonadaceae bacterium]|nr:hypothetical protein [Syntrophomonadaceae bacterium]MDD3888971.1 hypothetical protein [Syntrophomonadaceae bacterium]MDD4549708.1 hypothetical protein [Syntrophomonadaceae bacterium]
MARRRGVVMENGHGWAIIMTSDGELKKIKTGEPLLVGDIYEQPVSYNRYVAAAAIFLLLLVGTVDFCAVKAYAKVSNGVELGLNRWDRIVSVQATSAAGEQVVNRLSLKGQKIDTAVQAVVQEAVEINSNEQVSISLKSIHGKNDKNEEKVLTAISNKLSNQSNESDSKKIIKSSNKIIINPESANSNSAKKPKKDKSEQGNNLDKGTTNKPDSSSGKSNQQPPGKIKNENQIKVPAADKKPQFINKEPPGQSIKKETSNKGNQQKVIKEKKNSPSANSEKKIKSQKTNNNKPAKGKSNSSGDGS